MNILRRLTRWWRAHAPVFVPKARYLTMITRLGDYEQRHYEDQQRIQQLTNEKENLLAQFATQRSLLANHERDKRRADVAYDEALERITELATEVRHLRKHTRRIDRSLLDLHISPN